MKTQLLFILILLPFLAFTQKGTITVKKDLPDIVGAWEMTDNMVDMTVSVDIVWDFKANGKIVELLYTKGDSLDLSQIFKTEKQGTWLLKNDTLTISFTRDAGEVYPTPKLWVVKAILNGDILILSEFERNRRIKFLRRDVTSK